MESLGARAGKVRCFVALWWSLSAASAAYVTTKRTFATTDGAADLAFFVRYFGRADPSATHDKGCLDRDLGWALPDKFGIHFPQSYVTPSSVDGASLRDWEARKLAAPPLSAFDSYATSFWLPDLGPHVRAFEADNVSTATRRAPGGGYVALVRTPGSGQALELQSPACAGCDDAEFAPFAPSECVQARALPKGARYYDAWLRKAAAAGWNATSGGLPAPIVAQLRVAVSDLDDDAAAFLDAFLPDLQVDFEADGDCELLRFVTSTAPFDGRPAIFGYDLEYVFVQNGAVEGWAAYQAWMNKLHAANVGEGTGFDRGLDFHVKIMAADDPTATRRDVSLDAFALLHESRGVPYHAFNVSNPCPGTGPPPPGPTGHMLYSAGPGGVQGVEFWGALDGTRWAADELFTWNGCSPTMSCT